MSQWGPLEQAPAGNAGPAQPGQAVSAHVAGPGWARPGAQAPHPGLPCPPASRASPSGHSLAQGTGLLLPRWDRPCCLPALWGPLLPALTALRLRASLQPPQLPSSPSQTLVSPPADHGGQISPGCDSAAHLPIPTCLGGQILWGCAAHCRGAETSSPRATSAWLGSLAPGCLAAAAAILGNCSDAVPAFGLVAQAQKGGHEAESSGPESCRGGQKEEDENRA